MSKLHSYLSTIRLEKCKIETKRTTDTSSQSTKAYDFLTRSLTACASNGGIDRQDSGLFRFAKILLEITQ